MLKEILLRFGFAALARPILGGTGAILVFHRIRAVDPALSFSPNYRNSVAPEAFERLLDSLAEDGVEILGLEEAMLRQQYPGDGRYVCLTFDGRLPRQSRHAAADHYGATGADHSLHFTRPDRWQCSAVGGTRSSRQWSERNRRRRPSIGGDRVVHWGWGREAAGLRCRGAFMFTARPEASVRMMQAGSRSIGQADFAALAVLHMMDWDMRRAAWRPARCWRSAPIASRIPLWWGAYRRNRIIRDVREPRSAGTRNRSCRLPACVSIRHRADRV